eukprot:319923-Prymnesium_polylepis.1
MMRALAVLGSFSSFGALRKKLLKGDSSGRFTAGSSAAGITAEDIAACKIDESNPGMTEEMVTVCSSQTFAQLLMPPLDVNRTGDA